MLLIDSRIGPRKFTDLKPDKLYFQNNPTMESKFKASNIFGAGRFKSFLHNEYDGRKDLQNKSVLPVLQEEIDEKDIRIRRNFVAPKPYVVLKRRGFLFTEKDKTGFFACFSGKRKTSDVELVNRRLSTNHNGSEAVHINFNTMRVAIEDEGDNAFYLAVHATVSKNKQRFYFEKGSGEQIDQWKADIGKAIAGSEGEKYPLTYLSSLPEFWKTDSMTENEFRVTADTGDILLFRSTHRMASLQRGITASDFDHVAVVIRNQKNDLIMFESNTNSGVALCPWRDMIKYRWYQGVEKIVYRKLNIERNDNILTKAQQFIAENIDKEFKLDIGKIFKFTSSLQPTEAEKKQRTYFCSELVAAFYKALGLLEKETSCTQYYPVHFTESKKLGLLQGELGPEQTICFDIEPISDNYK